MSTHLSYNGKTHPRVGLKDMVAEQLPEFVRANYPTFVAFVEAYYEWMDQNDIDLSLIRDIDTTLDDFIKYFKAELAHNYPIVSENYNTERFLLKHIKEQYLAKGSEASYKLLFRLLFGKDVFIDYPGQKMLRISDGRWTQDVSLFVKVLQGDPIGIIGKIVDVQTSQKIYNLNIIKGVDAADRVTATVENVVKVEGLEDVYEIFVNRNFYGDIRPFDSIKFGSDFQGTILPSTTRIKIGSPGKNFRPGQVFQISSGEGTSFWIKVSEIYDNGGLKKIDAIRFGLGYTTDFSVTILPTSAVTTKKKISKSTGLSISYNKLAGKIGAYEITNTGANYTIPPILTVVGDGSGAVLQAVISGGEIVGVEIIDEGDGYNTAFIQINNAPGDTTGVGGEIVPILGSVYDYNFDDQLNGFTEGGYVNWGDYWATEYSDGAYVGTVARQFFINAADTTGTDPARLEVTLGAVAKYPGYYKTNDGFLDDSMFIQDSYYYQAFAYVLKIDEQLQSYASIVRSMLHPSGMAMFGEYSINNVIPLQIALTALVKSLGVTLYDIATMDDTHRTYSMIKDLSDTPTATELITKFIFGKYLEDSVAPTHSDSELSRVLGKNFGTGQDALNQRVIMTEQLIQTFTKKVEEDKPYVGYSLTYPNGEIVTKVYTKGVATTDSVVTMIDLYGGIQHPLKTVQLNSSGNSPWFNETIDSTVFGNTGYVVMEPYEQGGYFAEIYANGRASTW